MDIGFFIHSKNQLRTIMNQEFHPKWILFGDYGCYKRIPGLLELKQEVTDKNVYFHYISPKINMSMMEEEYRKVRAFLNQGIPVSINDLGLLYKLHSHIDKEVPVYMGRLLTKSVNRWVWGNLHLSGEDGKTKEYFAQNNFFQQEKMELFKEWNLAGIETTAFSQEEQSLKQIKKSGFRIIGYRDQTIGAVSRACPIARDKKITVKGQDCSQYCLDREYEIRPASNKQKERYPKLLLDGTVLMKTIESPVTWKGYEKLVYSLCGEAYLKSLKKMQEGLTC